MNYGNIIVKRKVGVYMAPLIIIMAVVFIIVFAVPVVLREFYLKNNTVKTTQRDIKRYDREVDSIHITSDFETERRRRLDQLKSLYEAGMMESEEYYERKQGIEDDFRR